MTKKKIPITIAIIFMIITTATHVFSDSSVLKGKDFARLGKSMDLKGTLEQMGDEWFLNAGDNLYALHLGPNVYRESKGFVLTEGNTADVKGFVYKDDVAVQEISSGGQYIKLRDNTGRSAWAGSKFSNKGAGN
jgi:hypothetical protein